jgi:class 3 adenylate cyclase
MVMMTANWLALPPIAQLCILCFAMCHTADVVEFTAMSKELPPEEVIAFINNLFSAFDLLVSKHGVQKVRTLTVSQSVPGRVAGKPPSPESRAFLLPQAPIPQRYDRLLPLNIMSADRHHGRCIHAGQRNFGSGCRWI